MMRHDKYKCHDSMTGYTETVGELLADEDSEDEDLVLMVKTEENTEDSEDEDECERNNKQQEEEINEETKQGVKMDNY